jgi:nitrogen regulatory protein PII
VRHRLTDIAVEGLTVTEAIGFGHQRGRTSFYMRMRVPHRFSSQVACYRHSI